MDDGMDVLLNERGLKGGGGREREGERGREREGERGGERDRKSVYVSLVSHDDRFTKHTMGGHLKG
jgi:hypothetical protein